MSNAEWYSIWHELASQEPDNDLCTIILLLLEDLKFLGGN